MKLKFLSLVLILLSVGAQAQKITEIGNYKMLYISVEDASHGIELELSDVSISSCGRTPGAEIVEESLSDDLSLFQMVGRMITMDCPVRVLPGGRFEAFPPISYLRKAKIKILNTSNSDRFTKSILIPSTASYSVKAI